MMDAIEIRGRNFVDGKTAFWILGSRVDDAIEMGGREVVNAEFRERLKNSPLSLLGMELPTHHGWGR